MATLTSNPKAVRPGVFKAELIQADQGVQSTLPAGFSFAINGVAQTQAQIDATLQSYIEAFKAVDAALAVYQAAVAARLAVTAAAREYCKALKSAIKNQFGNTSEKLAAFGINPDKALSRTSQEKLVTSMKRLQTRSVRTTRGKKQLAAIKVVGNPAIKLASDGTAEISPPPINIGVLGPSTKLVPAAPSPAPASSGTGTPGSSKP